MRLVTKFEKSSRAVISGWLVMKSLTMGKTWSLPNSAGAVMNSWPRGLRYSPAASASGIGETLEDAAHRLIIISAAIGDDNLAGCTREQLSAKSLFQLG